jgi:hypothetical protein
MYLFTYIHTSLQYCRQVYPVFININIYIHINIYIYIHIPTHTYTYLDKFHIYICIFIYLYICIYVFYVYLKKKPMLKSTYVTALVSGPGGPYGRPSLDFSGDSALLPVQGHLVRHFVWLYTYIYIHTCGCVSMYIGIYM